MKAIRYYIDKSELLEQTAHVTGWALSLTDEPLTIQVRERGGQPVEAALRRLSRPDASRAVLGDDRRPDCGFDVKFSCDPAKRYELVFDNGRQNVRLALSAAALKKETGQRFLPFRRIVRMTSASMAADDLRYLLRKGPGALKERWIRRYETDENKYMRWLLKHVNSQGEQAAPGQTTGRPMPAGAAAPLVSLLVPLYNTPLKFYRPLLECVTGQTYENWQLCLADGSTDGIDRQSCLPKDSRIRYRKMSGNMGISGNTNEALSMAEGEWIALMDHDDLLERTALAEMVQAARSQGADMVYSDEDKVSLDGKHFYDPHFKSDFNPDLLRSNNYICHFLMVRRDLAVRAGGFRSAFDGAQDYDFILRVSELAGRIVHLPRVLYHWRMHPLSTAENPESKGYAFEAGRRAIEEHLHRVGLSGRAESTDRPGYYRVRYTVKNRPRISVIIPNKDQAALLRTCVESIRARTDWPDYEIIIVENNSTTEEIREYYQELSAWERVRILTWEQEFNYAAINNFGVSHSTGEYVVLLNNDTEVITADWLTEMAGIAARPEVGVVGAKLFYEDGTVQHAGVVMKLAGCCGHVFYGAEREDPGRYARAGVIQDYSAVTAACLMCRRQVWDRLGGLSTDFKVAYNDVDFCLRARQAGYLVVFTPYAQLYHYESRTRGYEEGSEKQARFRHEQELLKTRYPLYMEEGDPYYNPNLTLIAPDFAPAFLHEGAQE